MVLSGLTTAQIQAELDRVTYRPGWTFTTYQHPHEGTWLRIIAPVPNAYPPHHPVDLGINVPMPPFETTGQLHRWLHWRIQRVEIHESCEWYTVDGQRPFDPHAVA